MKERGRPLRDTFTATDGPLLRQWETKVEKDNETDAGVRLGLNEAERCVEQAKRAESWDGKIAHLTAAIAAIIGYFRYLESESRLDEMNQRLGNKL
jgi:hypothetical protein